MNYHWNWRMFWEPAPSGTGNYLDRILKPVTRSRGFGTGRIRPLADSKQATLTQNLMAAADRKPISKSCRFRPSAHPRRPQRTLLRWGRFFGYSPFQNKPLRSLHCIITYV
jgi:hypothetical protein